MRRSLRTGRSHERRNACVSKAQGAPDRNIDLRKLYQTVREATARLGAPLSDADATVQSMPDASPAKWHLAHTTWFFERMILEQNLPGYRAFDRQFNFLFNSYYESVGARQPRPQARHDHAPVARHGHRLSRPCRPRDGVAHAGRSFAAVADLIELGCNHEQQHQELLLTDILHLFAQNPLHPAYKDPGPIAVARTDERARLLSQVRRRRGGDRARRPRLRLRLRGAAASRAARAL